MVEKEIIKVEGQERAVAKTKPRIIIGTLNIFMNPARNRFHKFYHPKKNRHWHWHMIIDSAMLLAVVLLIITNIVLITIPEGGIKNYFPNTSKPTNEKIEKPELSLSVNIDKKILGNGSVRLTEEQKGLLKFTRRKIFAVRDIFKGEAFTKENIAVLRPGNKDVEEGLHPREYFRILNSKASQDIPKFSLIKENFLEKIKKVLVTGGTGLIGYEITKQLVENGFEVNVLDLWPVKIKGINYFNGTVLNQDDINRAIKGCSYVFHLAAIMGVSKSLRTPVECLNVNIIGTYNILDCCVKNKVEKVLLSSSSEVYGEPETIPIKEDDTLHPKSEYGVSKYVGEEYLKAFKKQYGLDYTIVRYFNIYGPRQSHAWVMPIFINNALLGKKLKIYGDGNQVRAFCFVEDAARGTIKAMFGKNTNGGVFNIGNMKEDISMKELALTILKLAGKSSDQIEFIPLDNSDRSKKREIFKRIPSTLKALDILDFEAKVSIKEGIEKIIDFKKGRLDELINEVKFAEETLK